jgi:hypothetical protein
VLPGQPQPGLHIDNRTSMPPNAQTSVDGACQIIVSCDVVDAANDKLQAVPLAQAARVNLEQAGIAAPTDAAGQPQKIPTTMDTGYYSETAV